MKKLNRKGFTLIELLAVIVILAIVLVVTIPSVINSMNDARSTSLQNAADTIAEWIGKQYELAVLGPSLGQSGSVDSVYLSDIEGQGGIPLNPSNQEDVLELTTDVIQTAGVTVKLTEIDDEMVPTLYGYVFRNNNRICVILEAYEGSDFYVNSDEYDNFAISAGCSGSTLFD